MILIGLGANLEGPLGLPENALRAFVSVLQNYDIQILRGSKIWRTAPVPVSDQPWYCNAVCSIKTSLSAQDLLKLIKNIEKSNGRIQNEINAPRVIDLDILCYNGEILTEGNLVIPHPRMHHRAFVLYPLQQVAPDWVHPVMKQSVSVLIAALPSGQEVRCLEGDSLA